MVSFTVRLRFDLEDHNAVREMLRPLTVGSREEAGCIMYVAHFVEDDPATVLIYEQYVDEAALERHRASPHFERYAIRGLYQLMKERSTERLVAVC